MPINDPRIRRRGHGVRLVKGQPKLIAFIALWCLWQGCADSAPQNADVAATDTDDGGDVATDIDRDQSDVGTDDTGSDIGADVSPDTGDAAPDTDTNVEPWECFPTDFGTSFQLEPSDSASEYADCISGCSHDEPIPIIDLSTFARDGVLGRIDGNSHSFSSSGVENGPDVDIVGISVPARTLVDITVEPADDLSNYQSVFITHDGFQGMTFGSEFPPQQRVARSVIAAPYVGGLPFFVSIEHAPNYEIFGADDADYEGGASTTYLLRFRTRPFEPMVLGTATDGDRLVQNSALNCSGDTQYFEFRVEGPIGTRSVRVSATAGSEFVPTIVALNGTGGQLVWEEVVSDATDGAQDGDVELLLSSLVPDGSNYYFAVTDWNGAGDAFEYGIIIE